jgi:hypothetical protein
MTLPNERHVSFRAVRSIRHRARSASVEAEAESADVPRQLEVRKYSNRTWLLWQSDKSDDGLKVEPVCLKLEASVETGCWLGESHH